jgi:hypothetical protein
MRWWLVAASAQTVCARVALPALASRPLNAIVRRLEVVSRPATDAAFFDALRAEDPLGAVVRAHIHIEARLNLVIEALTRHPKHLPSLRFEQRAKLAVALGLHERILPALLEFGSIRNAFSHRLDVTLTDAMVSKLLDAFNLHDRETIIQAHELTVAQVPDEAMPTFEKADARLRFIMMAIAFDKFLQTAEKEARVDGVA